MTRSTLLRTLLVLPLVLVFGVMSASAGFKVGDKATDFSLKNANGKEVSLAKYKDAKGFIVVFTCNHCPFAKLYEDRIIALDKQFASKGYPVIAINSNDPSQAPDDSFENMVKRARTHEYTFPYLFDEAQTVVAAYGATNTPHVFILQKENADLMVRYIGAIDDNAQNPMEAPKHYVENAVNALLTGKAIAVNQTKAIGCGILLKKK